jgi:anti-anti-sigma factor
MTADELTDVSAAPELRLTVAFRSDAATIALSGEIDVASAPRVRALVGATLDTHQGRLALDLADVTFLDASGLRVIVYAVQRLRRRDRLLGIRSPSPAVRRLLDLTNVTDTVHIDSIGADNHLGQAQEVDEVGAAGTAIDATIRQAAASPLADIVDAALGLVVALAQAAVQGADGVSVSLTRHGRIVTVAASDEKITEMDHDQYLAGEGPCMSAAAEGRWFHVESVDDEERWPDFISRAREHGVKSILSSPLTATAGPVGALNIYSNVERAFGVHEQELASQFAAQASTVLLAAAVDVTDAQLDERMREALETRDLIARAQGVLMVRDHVTAEEAFGILRRRGRHPDVPVRQLAADIVASTVPPAAPR